MPRAEALPEKFERVARMVTCLICNRRYLGGVVVTLSTVNDSYLEYCLRCARGIRDALKRRVR